MADLLEPGQEFVGRYRIERALAQGGMGAVFVAEQIATELTVAIKVLFPQILGSKDAVEKFQFEAKVAARVNSEHIVKVMDAGYDEESGLPFLVMELLDGQELDAVVGTRGPLPADLVAEYIRQVASGLDKARGYTRKDGAREPIVHRDLKPENIFLAQRESGEPVVKILDFGIAKVLSDSAKVSQEIKGTPLFMAYEQATGSELSPQTDIWALGLIAFYLLTGEIYWKAASNPNADVSALFAEVLSLPIEPPTDRIRQLGKEPTWQPAFDAWFARCVDRDPSARFGSAGEAAVYLARALGVPDQLSPSKSGSLDATMAGAEHLGATQPAAVGAVAQVVDTQTRGTPTGMATEGAMAMAHTAVGHKKSSALPLALGALGVLVVVGGAFAMMGTSDKGVEDELATSGSSAPLEGSAEAPDDAKTEAKPVPSEARTQPRPDAQPPDAQPLQSAQPVAPVPSAVPPATVSPATVSPAGGSRRPGAAPAPPARAAPRPVPPPAPISTKRDLYNER